MTGRSAELTAALTLALAAALPLAGAAHARAPIYYPLNGPPAEQPFSEAVRVGDTLYLSGRLGIDPTTGKLSPDLAVQTRQAMENIGATLRKHGLTHDDLFKCTVMLTDMSHWADFNAVYLTYFKPGRLPARSAFGAAGLARGAQLELECWARFPEGK